MDKSIRAICVTVVIVAAMIVSLQLYKAWSDHDVVHQQQLMEFERQKLAPGFYFTPPQPPSVPREKQHYSYEFELPGTPKGI